MEKGSIANSYGTKSTFVEHPVFTRPCKEGRYRKQIEAYMKGNSMIRKFIDGKLGLT